MASQNFDRVLMKKDKNNLPIPGLANNIKNQIFKSY